MGGKATFDQLLAQGKAQFVGDRKPFDELRGALTIFTPDFELMLGTKLRQLNPPSGIDPFAVQSLAITGND